MQVGILGPLAVRSGDEVVEIRRGIPRTLLTALALRLGETVSADALTDLLWGDAQPANPANALQIQVSYLRKVLAAAEPDASLIVTRDGGYALAVDADDVDARRFERMVRDAAALASGGTAGDLHEAVHLLGTALALWRGEALVDVADAPFAMGEATRLTELRWEATESRNDLLLALGRHRELVGTLSQLVREQPLRERFHEQLMLALYRSGRQAEALRTYDDARRLLADQLGLDPGPQLQQLERDVLAHAAELDWHAPPGTAGTPEPATGPRPTVRPRPAAPPVPVSPLVGREVEIARVRGLLDRKRMVTLTGPAGAGKTRLAVQVATLQADVVEIAYVDLGDLSDPSQVAPALAAALGIPAPPDADAVALVAQWFEDRTVLVLLDTCEHVAAGAGAVASRILRHSPTARVLATSRRPLGIAGEIAWPVPPLALATPTAALAAEVATSPAVELFVDRATAVRPDFELTDANAADVAAICFALDGLPLAIELAAAHADVLTPAAIRARLADRFALLVDGSTDVAARQRTLRAAIDWSYELLDDDQRRLFLRLSVFAGTFDLDALLAMADDLSDPVHVLATLVRHSVVMVAGEDRYRLLDSLRAYAAARLDDDGAHRRHAEHFTQLAEAAAPHIRGPEQLDWLLRMRRDVPNFRAALAWSFANGEHDHAARLAGALGWFWTFEGMLDEAAQVFERAVAIDDAPATVRAWILSGFGLLVASLGDLRRARVLGAQAVAAARIADDGVVLGNALNTLAVAQWALGELDASADTHDEASACFEAAGDRWGRGLCIVLRARTAIDRGEPGAAALAEAAVSAARATGDRHVVGIAVEQLARVALVAGHLDAAAAYAAESLTLHESIGYTEGMAGALHLLGRAQLAMGDTATARSTHLRALALAHGIGHTAAMCEAVEDLARVAASEGDTNAAGRLLAAVHAERQARGITPHDLAPDPLDRIRIATVASVTTPGRSLADIVHDLL